MHEQVLTFPCAGDMLVGVLALPEQPAHTGVLIAVGGPQYRAGSHRQFVQISRALAQGGFAALRFDFRGMGDSEGEQRTYEQVDEDLDAAMGAFARALPSVKRIVLLGLCGGATAALLYWNRRGPDPRIGGLCLLNPWVRTEASHAAATVKHYYVERLKSAQFWRRLLSGRVALGAVTAALGALRRALSPNPKGAAAEVPFVERMARAAQSFTGPLLLVTSGRDFTAQEFLLATAGDVRWRELMGRPSTRHVQVPQADHTFSDPEDQRLLEAECLQWLREQAKGASGAA